MRGRDGREKGPQPPVHALPSAVQATCSFFSFSPGASHTAPTPLPPGLPPGLKYKLACGSIVFKFASKYTEFFEPALIDNVHVVRLAATDTGVDPHVFTSQTGPRLQGIIVWLSSERGTWGWQGWCAVGSAMSDCLAAGVCSERRGAVVAPARLQPCWRRPTRTLAACSQLTAPFPVALAAAPRIKDVVSRTVGAQEQPPIARQGQAFVREQLTVEALHCYWLGALQRYAELYFLPATPKQLEAQAKEGGGEGAAAATATSSSGDSGGVDEGKQRRLL